MAFCPNCGAENQNDSKFCVRCGTGLTAAVPDKSVADSSNNLNDGNISLKGAYKETAERNYTEERRTAVQDSELSALSSDIDNMGIMIIAFAVICFIPYVNSLSLFLMLVIICMTRWSLAQRTADFLVKKNLSEYADFARTGHNLSLRIIILYCVSIVLFLLCFGLFILCFVKHSVSAAVAGALFFVLTMVLCVFCNFITIRALDCFIRTRNVINAMKQGNVRLADVSQHWIATVLYILYGLSVAIGTIMLVILLCVCIAHWDEVRATIMNMNYSDLNQVM
jgi:hypothetical protein